MISTNTFLKYRYRGARSARTLLRAPSLGTATARTPAAVIDGCTRRRAGQARAAEHAGGHGTVDTDGEDVVGEGWALIESGDERCPLCRDVRHILRPLQVF